MTTLTRVSAIALIAGGTVAPSRAEPPGRPAPTETVLERFELAKGGSLILVPVELKGKTYRFAIDTGASSGVYDTSLASLLGDPIGVQDVRTTDGAARMTLFASPDARLGRLSLQTGSPVATTDMKRLRVGLGEDVYGLIGMDFLLKHVVRIDPDRGEVVFLRSAGPDPGERLAVTIENKLPYVQGRLAGLAKPIPFLVDTGCVPGGGTGLLRAETFDALVKERAVTFIDRALAGSLSGQSIRQRGRVAELEVGGRRHSDLIFAGSERDVLGVGYWRRYVATFDLGSGAIFLKKGDRFDHRDVHDLSGLTMVRVDGRTIVAGVDEGSPAALAGIKVQDVVLRANGEKVEDMALMALRRLLAEKGQKVTLRVGRGGDERQAAVELPK